MKIMGGVCFSFLSSQSYSQGSAFPVSTLLARNKALENTHKK